MQKKLMLKKNAERLQKLVLSTATIRQLSDLQLEKVGGATGLPCSDAHDACKPF
jgi:hypothetical protein